MLTEATQLPRATSQMADQTEQRAASLDLSTTLAIERTRASYERTMMSWIRTATSLITFGFSVYKFFQLEAPAGRQPNRLIGPRGRQLYRWEQLPEHE